MSKELPQKEEIRIELDSVWTGPIREKDYGKGPIPPEEWPYGDPRVHQKCCNLFEGGVYCDCEASEASNEDNRETDK